MPTENIARPVAAAPPAPPKLLTIRETARVCGVSPKTVFAWTRSGELPAIRLGKRCVRYRPCDLDAFIASKRA